MKVLKNKNKNTPLEISAQNAEVADTVQALVGV